MFLIQQLSEEIIIKPTNVHCKELIPGTEHLKENILRKGIAAWPQSQFPHLCVCERFISSHDRSAYSAAGIDPGMHKSLADT
jgi:hypothetical protein